MNDTPVLWPFAPNWRSPYSISYEFKTDLFTSDDGGEQRRALRSTPRKTIQFSAVAHGDGLRRFNRLVDTSQNKLIVLPEVTRVARTAASTSDGADRFELAGTAPYWIAPGSRIVITHPLRRYALATVVEVVGQMVRVAAPLDANEAGAAVHPGITGRLPLSFGARRVTSTVAEVSVSFKGDPCAETYDFGVPGATYGDTEWLQLDHNWLEGMPVDHGWPLGSVDFGRGRISTYVAVSFPTIVRTYDLLVRDAEPIVQFFGRMRGRRTHFLISTMEHDLIPVSLPGGEYLKIGGTEIYDAYRDDQVRTMIEIAVAGAPRLARQIVGMTVANGDTVLQLGEPLPAIDLSQVLRVSWLLRARFASDTLEVVYTTTGAARILLNIQSLPSGADSGAVLRATMAADIRQTADGSEREVISL